MDLIFAGLVRRFGKENVIDYPARAKHRRGRPVLIGDHESDYGAERQSLCYVEDCENIKEWSLGEIKKEKIDYIWLDETVESYNHWLELSIHADVVVVAGHDNFRGSPQQVFERYNRRGCTLFVDDWRQEYDELDNTYLINLSCNFDHLWEVQRRDEFLADKQYDICFIGYNSNPKRKVVIDHINKQWGHLNNCIIFEERPNQFDRFIRHDEMFKLMAQSRVCLNLPGASTNERALRFYEIPYVGSYMITKSVITKLLSPFPDTSYLQFSRLGELDECINSALSIPMFRELSAREAHVHCMKHHTIDARMDYIFGVLNE